MHLKFCRFFSRWWQFPKIPKNPEFTIHLLFRGAATSCACSRGSTMRTPFKSQFSWWCLSILEHSAVCDFQQQLLFSHTLQGCVTSYCERAVRNNRRICEKGDPEVSAGEQWGYSLRSSMLLPHNWTDPGNFLERNLSRCSSSCSHPNKSMGKACFPHNSAA